LIEYYTKPVNSREINGEGEMDEIKQRILDAVGKKSTRRGKYGIIIKTDAEIAIMREAGRITAEVLKVLTSSVKAGMRTDELDIIAEREPKRFGAIPSFKGYHGYPASVCCIG